MPAWPASLPVPVIQDYRATDGFSTLETPMESGPPRLARLTAHYLTTGTASLYCTAPQMATLRAALAGAADGASWFTGFPLDMGGGSVPHRARIRDLQVRVIVPGITWLATLQFETDERKLT